MNILVNHVMSTDIHSAIFEDFINRLINGSPKNILHQITTYPLTKADIYHFHRPQKCNVNTIPKNSLCTLHFDPLDLRQHDSIDKLFERFKFFKKIVFLNKNSYEQCHFLEEKRVLIPHGYDEKLTLRDNKKPHTGINIGFFCKKYNDGRKGEGYLFEIYNKIFQNQKKKLFLIGNGWPESLTTKAKDIIIIQPQDYRSIIQIYSIMDIVIITSPYEGGPACLPEALAAGCDVFSTRCGMAEDFLPMQNLLDFNIINDAKKIEEIYNIAKKDKQLKMTQRLLSWDTVSNHYSNLYQSMYEKRHIT